MKGERGRVCERPYPLTNADGHRSGRITDQMGSFDARFSAAPITEFCGLIT